MRWLVNGDEHDFGDVSAEIRREGDRVWIHAADGWKSAAFHRAGNQTLISYRGRQYLLEPLRSSPSSGTVGASGEIRAPMPGLLVSLLVKQDDQVKKGQVLMVLEAMKTQISLTAPFDGFIEELTINALQQVKSNQILAIVR